MEIRDRGLEEAAIDYVAHFEEVDKSSSHGSIDAMAMSGRRYEEAAGLVGEDNSKVGSYVFGQGTFQVDESNLGPSYGREGAPGS